MTLQVLIPMAGEGARFRAAGYDLPKPLIDVAGKPMIRRVMDSLTPADGDVRFVLVSRIDVFVHELFAADCVLLDGPTRGAVETIAAAEFSVQPGPVLVANCDQLIDVPVDEFVSACVAADAGLIVFNSTNPHHSYVRTDYLGRVTDIVEKQVVSDLAVAGVYWFADSGTLFDYCRKVIDKDDRVNGEFYLSSALSLMVADGLDVRAWEIDVHDKHMLGTPEELRIYLDKVDAGKVAL